MQDAQSYYSTFIYEFYRKEVVSFSELISVMSEIFKQYYLPFLNKAIIYIIISLFIFGEKRAGKIKGCIVRK